MATSMATVSRKLCHRLLLSNSKASASQISRSFFSTKSEGEGEESALKSGSDSDSDSSASSDSSDSESSHSAQESSASAHEASASASESSPPKSRRAFVETVLEDGLDMGIYKAVIVGQIGQTPLEKKNKYGSSVVLTSVGTGGMRSERVPFANEEPREYADRSAVQWHRVAIYHPPLGRVLMTKGLPGTIVYLEGNMETRIFSDPITGLVRRIREIAIRRNGRLVFLGGGSDYKPSDAELRGVGYY